MNVDAKKVGYGYVVPRYSVMTRENILANMTETNKYPNFWNDYIFSSKEYKEQYELAYRRLAAIYYTRIAENGQVPSMVTLFKLHDISSDDIIPEMVWIIHYLPHLLQNAYLSAGNQVKKNMTSPEIYVLRLVQMNMDQCHLTYMRKQTVLICLLQVLLVPEIRNYYHLSNRIVYEVFSHGFKLNVS